MYQPTKWNWCLCTGDNKQSLNQRSAEKENQGYTDLLHPMSGLKVGVITCSDCSHGCWLPEQIIQNILRKAKISIPWKLKWLSKQNHKTETKMKVAHLIAGVRLCRVLKVWVWPTGTVAGREQDDAPVIQNNISRNWTTLTRQTEFPQRDSVLVFLSFNLR